MTLYTLSLALDHVRDQPEFDRLVETLLRREMGDAAIVVNGRGGDDGIDVKVALNGEVTIFQLKYFPEGFSSGFKKSRQGQIKSSFDTAMEKQRPDRWVLVVPSTLTNEERDWVLKLKSEHHSPKEIAWWDRSHLDDIMARHPDIPAYHLRDELAHLVSLFRVEEEALAQPRVDFTNRLHRLIALAESTTGANWGVDVIHRDGELTMIPRPKNPAAHELEPIAWTATVDPAKLTVEQAQALKYGTRTGTPLSEEAVTVTDYIGPSIFEGAFRASDLHLSGPSTVPVGALLELRLDLGGIFVGIVSHGGPGIGGYSLCGNFGRVEIDLLLPPNVSEAGTLMHRYTPENAYPEEWLHSMQLLEALQVSSSLSVYVDEVRLGSMQLPPTDEDRLSEIRDDLALATDWVTLQKHTHVRHPYPTAYTKLDLVQLQVVGLLLSGRRATLPAVRDAYTVAVPDLEALDAFLNMSTPVALPIQYSVVVCRRKYSIGSVLIFFEDDRIIEGADLARAELTATSSESEASIILRSGGRRWLTGCIEDLALGVGGELPAVTRWSIPGIVEPGFELP